MTLKDPDNTVQYIANPKTLEECALALEAHAQRLRELKQAGWELTEEGWILTEKDEYLQKEN